MHSLTLDLFGHLCPQPEVDMVWFLLIGIILAIISVACQAARGDNSSTTYRVSKGVGQKTRKAIDWLTEDVDE